MMTESRRGLEFVYTPLFLASARGLFDDEALRQIEITLLVQPRTGDVIAGTGGIRKLRAALPGRGKRGGARLVYLYLEVRGTVYMLLAYAKNEQVDLSTAEKRALRNMVKKLEEAG
jgi:hypothetical protein